MKIQDEFNINGRGVILTLDYHQFGLKRIKKLSELKPHIFIGKIIEYNEKKYEIKGIEYAKGMCIANNIGLNVKEIKK